MIKNEAKEKGLKAAAKKPTGRLGVDLHKKNFFLSAGFTARR